MAINSGKKMIQDYERHMKSSSINSKTTFRSSISSFVGQNLMRFSI